MTGREAGERHVTGQHVAGRDLQQTKQQFEHSMLQQGHMTLSQVHQMEKEMTQHDWDVLHANQVKASQRTVDQQFGTPSITSGDQSHQGHVQQLKGAHSALFGVVPDREALGKSKMPPPEATSIEKRHADPTQTKVSNWMDDRSTEFPKTANIGVANLAANIGPADMRDNSVPLKRDLPTGTVDTNDHHSNDRPKGY